MERRKKRLPLWEKKCNSSQYSKAERKSSMFEVEERAGVAFPGLTTGQGFEGRALTTEEPWAGSGVQMGQIPTE